MVNLLLSHPHANVNCKDKDDDTPIWLSTYSSCDGITESLLAEKDTNVNFVGGRGGLEASSTSPTSTPRRDQIGYCDPNDGPQTSISMPLFSQSLRPLIVSHGPLEFSFLAPTSLHPHASHLTDHFIGSLPEPSSSTELVALYIGHVAR
ncbi:hypothetical protein ACN42_g11394 [Penicillium freii]|uniref:Fatty acid synthase subunit beta N-terminal domain-containing protein n=1 Tax=Penicillium freii TaxID=48697 RepID=A0A101M8B5_PENFR|nr:hypothetical protein ACN42_g11394 [Penicillium freii]